MDYVKKVNNLCLNGNLSENWRRFKQNYDIFEEAAGIKSQTENMRIASFLNTIGEEALELFNSFNLSVKERKCFTQIQNAFENHCMAKKRIVHERFKFFSRRQCKNEMLKTYLADLTKMAATCDFKEQKYSLIRDQFVSGILDKALQADLLLFEDDLNFDKIVELLEQLSVYHHQQKDQAAEEASDDIITEELFPVQLRKTNDTESVGMIELIGLTKVLKEEKPKSEYFGEHPCKRCNLKHKFRDCPAFGKNCLKCFQLNHFAICCNIKTDNFKNPCLKCNSKHEFRHCPAFGKKCSHCYQLHHFAVNCPRRRADC